MHVAWNGSGLATPRAPADATPMRYARLHPERRAFEPQRNLLQCAVGLDGGGAIAADDKGRVFVAWHAGGAGSQNEGDRRVWVTKSSDDGATFTKEQAASDVSTGACGCCGMDGLIDRQGSIYFLLPPDIDGGCAPIHVCKISGLESRRVSHEHICVGRGV